MVPPGRPDRRRYYTTFPFRRQAAFAVLIAETFRPTYNTLRIVALLYAGIPFLFRHSPLPHAAPRIKSSPASRGFFRIFIRIFLSQIDIIFCKIITTKSYTHFPPLFPHVSSPYISALLRHFPQNPETLYPCFGPSALPAFPLHNDAFCIYAAPRDPFPCFSLT